MSTLVTTAGSTIGEVGARHDKQVGDRIEVSGLLVRDCLIVSRHYQGVILFFSWQSRFERYRSSVVAEHWLAGHRQEGTQFRAGRTILKPGVHARPSRARLNVRCLGHRYFVQDARKTDIIEKETFQLRNLHPKKNR